MAAARTATAPKSVAPVVQGAGAGPKLGACASIPSENYAPFTLNSPPLDRLAEQHPDLNLGLRGYTPVVDAAGLVDIGGDTAPNAPQLDQLFSGRRLPTWTGDYQVYGWDWGANKRAGPIASPNVTLIGVAVSPGEVIHLPDAGTNIGLGFSALVLYAASDRITLKYTGEDSVLWGYTLHLEHICVEPRLLALYQQLNASGRSQLPALRAGQALGHPTGGELGIAIRDNGSFMDPRSRKDWWRDY